MSKSKSGKSGGKDKAKSRKPADPAAGKGLASRGTRETIESIVVAVILAFLFRGFEAEAFVIPTGSMADTLKGRHVDVECPQCQQRYQMGASIEVSDTRPPSVVVAASCPICRYTMKLDYFGSWNQRSFTGDRILVNKFAYDLASPNRWDVIVFKYPGNAKQNYIKRLIGLPNEVIMIRHGDIFVLKKTDLDAGDRRFRIARKPPHKIKAMLQLVDDSRHIATGLVETGWPSRWQPWREDGPPAAELRSCGDDLQGLTIDASDGPPSWLRYHHFVPSAEHWAAIRRGQKGAGLSKSARPQLISDFYTYNAANGAYYTRPEGEIEHLKTLGTAERKQIYQQISVPAGPIGQLAGSHWVGDLALECDVDVQGEQGQLMLDLVEGGVRFQCRIDLAGGQATLEILDGSERVTFDGGDGQDTRSRTSKKPVVSGPGRYRLRLSNIDNEIRLWVDKRVIEFNGATTYDPGDNVKPVIRGVGRPSDLAPAGIGANNARLSISRLRVLRDIYYIATRNSRYDDDYDYISDTDSVIEACLRDPLSCLYDPRRQQNLDELMDSRREVYLPDANDSNTPLGPNVFLPMGDNSPQSQDARIWSKKDIDNNDVPPPYVPRELLIGKAVFIYWPHHWWPFWPSFDRMGLIR